ncbi:transcriptional regulator, TetR family [Paraburkholderia susongensis]|uniref:Transcriptional regulator, TetR family n=1 Tax=Paraburkholderia susongensis TaxID=1515439 RepID=A0A1X7LZA9_9BURK|nr:transcriptional regulator, TetR family [Paraburkholderia susongensis]
MRRAQSFADEPKEQPANEGRVKSAAQKYRISERCTPRSALSTPDASPRMRPSLHSDPRRGETLSQNDKTDKTSSAPKKAAMYDSIKDVARKLLIAHGYHKTTFGVIAKELGITTTNIHYHFGNKNSLVEEVVKDYVAGAIAGQKTIWLDETMSLQEKVLAEIAFNRTLYRRYNPSGRTRKPWSLIGRLRLEGDVLTDEARAALAGFTTEIHGAIEFAVEHASRSGELKRDTPKEDLIFLLAHLVDSLSVFAQDAGGFERVEQFMKSFSRVVLARYTNPK